MTSLPSLSALLVRLAAHRAARADRRIPRDEHGTPKVRVTLSPQVAREAYIEAKYHGAHALRDTLRPYLAYGGYPYLSVAERDRIRKILRSETVV